MKKCSYCKDAIPREQHADPYTDDNGDAVCDSCYYDYFTFSCVRCCNLEEKKFEGAIGELFAVTDASVAPTGIYRVLDWPFYGGPMIGRSWLFEEAVKRVRKTACGCDTNGYPCGFICRECRGALLPTPKPRKPKCPK